MDKVASQHPQAIEAAGALQLAVARKNHAGLIDSARRIATLPTAEKEIAETLLMAPEGPVAQDTKGMFQVGPVP
jgi:hypothetical protein